MLELYVENLATLVADNNGWFAASKGGNEVVADLRSLSTV